MSFFEIIILSLIEGLTEYLPISSTGHLIVASALMGINESEVVKNFNIIIQAGAILAVLVLYPKRFLPIRLDFYLKLATAFLPAAVIGLFVKNQIDQILGSVTVVATTLVLGGIVLILFDRFKPDQANAKSVEGLTSRECLLIGFIQCLAFFPGVSRAAATIIGGMLIGLSRKEAAEFSFFLGVPTLLGASAIKSLKAYETLQPDLFLTYLSGIVLSFLVAVLAIRFFISFVQRFGFRYFGWYRIAVGLVLAILIYNDKL